MGWGCATGLCGGRSAWVIRQRPRPARRASLPLHASRTLPRRHVARRYVGRTLPGVARALQHPDAQRLSFGLETLDDRSRRICRTGGLPPSMLTPPDQTFTHPQPPSHTALPPPTLPSPPTPAAAAAVLIVPALAVDLTTTTPHTADALFAPCDGQTAAAPITVRNQGLRHLPRIMRDWPTSRTHKQPPLSSVACVRVPTRLTARVTSAGAFPSRAQRRPGKVRAGGRGRGGASGGGGVALDPRTTSRRAHRARGRSRRARRRACGGRVRLRGAGGVLRTATTAASAAGRGAVAGPVRHGAMRGARGPPDCGGALLAHVAERDRRAPARRRRRANLRHDKPDRRRRHPLRVHRRRRRDHNHSGGSGNAHVRGGRDGRPRGHVRGTRECCPGRRHHGAASHVPRAHCAARVPPLRGTCGDGAGGDCWAAIRRVDDIRACV